MGGIKGIKGTGADNAVKRENAIRKGRSAVAEKKRLNVEGRAKDGASFDELRAKAEKEAKARAKKERAQQFISQQAEIMGCGETPQEEDKALPQPEAVESVQQPEDPSETLPEQPSVDTTKANEAPVPEEAPTPEEAPVPEKEAGGVYATRYIYTAPR